MAQEETKSGEDTGEPVQLYRFKVRTADGREMVSAVAVVDPNADGEPEHDAANEKEDLEKKHAAEAKAHEDEVAAAHDDHADGHEEVIDKSHEDLKGKHEEALDAKHE